MNTITDPRLSRFSAWTGVASAVLVIGGWGVIAGFLLPPHDPTWDATTIAEFFREHQFTVRVGMILLMVAALATMPFSALISDILRGERERRGVLSYLSLLGGAAQMLLLFLPAIFWLVAAFRADRAPELVLLMNDLAWLLLIGGLTIFLALPIAIAIGAFTDKSENPAFPRWVGYFNAWVVTLMVPDQLIFFFHTGPFAWNGLFGLWVPAGIFTTWFVVMAIVMLRYIKSREELPVRS